MVEAAAHGARDTVPLAPVPIPCDVTVTIPPSETPGLEALVATEVTYLVPEPAETSQPQPLAAIVAPDAADWMVSVMLVRQDEPAKIT